MKRWAKVLLFYSDPVLSGLSRGKHQENDVLGGDVLGPQQQENGEYMNKYVFTVPWALLWASLCLLSPLHPHLSLLSSACLDHARSFLMTIITHFFHIAWGHLCSKEKGRLCPSFNSWVHYTNFTGTEVSFFLFFF